MEDFPGDLKFYWLHFEVDERLPVLPGATPLSIEQHCSVRDPQYVIALFRQFLSEQEKLQRSRGAGDNLAVNFAADIALAGI